MALIMSDSRFVQDAFGYGFQNSEFLMDALDTTGLRIEESNQRLAMLGDALLKHVVLDLWFASGTPRGHGNRLISNIGSNANLASTARRFGLEEHVVVHPGHMGSVSDKTLATTVEAILGAIYLDSEKDMVSVSRAVAQLGLAAGI